MTAQGHPAPSGSSGVSVAPAGSPWPLTTPGPVAISPTVAAARPASAVAENRPGQNLCPRCSARGSDYLRGKDRDERNARQRELYASHGRAPRPTWTPERRTCPGCHATFTPAQGQRQQIYCLAFCRDQHRLATLRATPRSSGRGKPGPLEVECRFCHGPMVSRSLKQHYCSPLCSRRALFKRLWASGSRRRFPHFNPKTRRAVAERDAWRCGLCGAVIDQAFRYPHPGSLSIDHIDPDGEHVPENWQASHLVCNVQAGDKRAVA